MRRREFLMIPAAWCAASYGQDGAAERLAAAGQKYFSDVALTTQNGDRVRLYSDLLQGRVVVIHSFFATCTGSCPMMTQTLAGMQRRLGERAKDVLILSISVDPQADTPAVLKAYAEKMNAQPGWLFLTGEKANVDFALSRLGQLVEKKEDHQTVFIVGNEKTGLWKKVLAPKATPETLKDVVESVLDDKG